MNYEWLGITGTILILIGFLSNDQTKIRLFDMAGSILFVIYGALIGSLSNIILNSVLAVVHVVKLTTHGKLNKKTY